MSDYQSNKDRENNENAETEAATGLPGFVWLVLLIGLVILSLWWTAGSP